MTGAAAFLAAAALILSVPHGTRAEGQRAGEARLWHVAETGGGMMQREEPAAEPEPEPAPAPEPEPAPSPRQRGERDVIPRGPLFVLLGRAADVRLAEEAVGGRIARREDLPALGLSMTLFDPGDTMTVPILRRRLARRGIDVAIDRNSRFEQAAGGRNYVRDLLGVGPGTACALPKPVRIGLVDGPVDTANPALAGVHVTSRSMLLPEEIPASPSHATALAALIAAQDTADGGAGLSPGARIFSAVTFSRRGGDTDMTLDKIVSAFDWFADERVQLVNMSIAGPRNGVLSAVLAAAQARGIVMVAAAGNDGRRELAYPAADPSVISVTAIDARKRRYALANTGSGMDFAAPGVDVLVPGTGAPDYRTGTSFASAIVTALVAHEIARGNTRREGIEEALTHQSEDLGRPGRDEEFGWGMIRLNGC